MTREMIRALSDEELGTAKGFIDEELALRTEKRKHDAIARIKALAGANGFSVTINGRRGRPPKTKAEAGTAKVVK